MGAVLRAWVLALVAVGVWFLSVYTGNPHGALDASAPATAFSSARADATLARVLGPEIPHPVSSAENAAVRARILKEFANLGVPAHTYQAFTCNAWRGFSFVACATVTDIVAEVIPGQGKAVAMMAHYDSVPAGPGASDDESERRHHSRNHARAEGRRREVRPSRDRADHRRRGSGIARRQCVPAEPRTQGAHRRGG
jgi:hypothetical protein